MPIITNIISLIIKSAQKTKKQNFEILSLEKIWKKNFSAQNKSSLTYAHIYLLTLLSLVEFVI